MLFAESNRAGINYGVDSRDQRVNQEPTPSSSSSAIPLVAVRESASLNTNSTVPYNASYSFSAREEPISKESSTLPQATSSLSEDDVTLFDDDLEIDSTPIPVTTNSELRNEPPTSSAAKVSQQDTGLIREAWVKVESPPSDSTAELNRDLTPDLNQARLLLIDDKSDLDSSMSSQSSVQPSIRKPSSVPPLPRPLPQLTNRNDSTSPIVTVESAVSTVPLQSAVTAVTAASREQAAVKPLALSSSMKTSNEKNEVSYLS